LLDTQDPQVAAGLFAAAIALWFVASIAWRAFAGKPFFAMRRPNSTFDQRWASGRVGTGLLARLSTARNCLHIQVSEGTLHIHPHFPFTLGFLPEIYDLDQAVPLSAIQGAAILGGKRVKAVEVRFRTPTGEEETLQLLLKGAEGFVHAVMGNRGLA
jgi:hypothetical protein